MRKGYPMSFQTQGLLQTFKGWSSICHKGPNTSKTKKMVIGCKHGYIAAHMQSQLYSSMPLHTHMYIYFKNNLCYSPWFLPPAFVELDAVRHLFSFENWLRAGLPTVWPMKVKSVIHQLSNNIKMYILFLDQWNEKIGLWSAIFRNLGLYSFENVQPFFSKRYELINFILPILLVGKH